MSNVHFIGTPRKTGRRRERPLPDAPLADVRSLIERLGKMREQRVETPEEKVVKLDKALDNIAYHILQISRIIREQGDTR
ncbi:hypothetical protein AWB69_00003 [Caballeronia udeis]|uniref:Uncharacterized protein n=1 Tax=Caballeronia udeis TaxID=1232866 RepID=A0A158ENX5_9BURK|nr:hypothetical protein [Caballeronia udeis]SAL09237.1 hypothetical protein AWB69_00003 [Caballeronia udeis]